MEKLPVLADPLPETVKLTPCEMAAGYVIYDAVVLVIGAVGLRASVKASTIEEMAGAAKPVMSAIEEQISIIAHEGSTAFQRARACFGILSTLSGGGMLGAIFKAFQKSLTWWQGLLYGISGLATILAALATDGVAVCAEIVLLLVSFTYLVIDARSAVKTCGLLTKAGPPEGNTQSPSPNPQPYQPQVALLTAKGYLVSVAGNRDLDSKAAFSTNRKQVGAWEKFTIETVDQANHTFAIKTSSGKYITAVNGGGDAGASGTAWAVQTSATTIAQTETLILQMQEDGTYALMTSRGYYVTAVSGGGKAYAGDPMQTVATTVGPNEVFSAQVFQCDGVTAQQVMQVTTSTVLDASFESPNLPANHFEYSPAGSPWIFSSSAGIAANGSGFTNKNPPAPNGDQVAFLQQKGSMSQTIVFGEGTYRLSFYAAQRANYGSNTFNVLVDGALIGSFTPTSTSYTHFTTNTFTVKAGSHTILFQGTNPSGKDTTCFIDMVQLSGGH